MPKKEEGFFEGLIKDLAFQAAIESSRDKSGKPDPYKAAGIAAGLGHTSFEDTMRLGAMLGAQGAFDSDEYDSGSLDDKAHSSQTSLEDDWREDCEDGSEYGLDPKDYNTEAEYEDVLHDAKYSWREYCEDGSEFDVDPEDFETEDEYMEELEEARNAWRDYAEDGSEYGLDPEDFDTEDDYNYALEEAKQENE